MASARFISDQTVKEKTGKNSSEWYKIVDKFATKNHTEIAKLLYVKYKLSAWWSQIITNRYEWERGLRVK